MQSCYPTLSYSGWFHTIEKKMSMLFANALCADYSQSNMYRGNTVSIPYIFITHINEPDALIETLKKELLNYYLNSFSDTTSDVTIDASYVYNITDQDKFTVNISVTVMINGEKFNLSEFLPSDLKPVLDVIKEFN